MERVAIVARLINDPFRPKLQSAFGAWRSIVDGPPRIARERFGWEAREAVPPATEARAAVEGRY
jgi:hypothetical protein